MSQTSWNNFLLLLNKLRTHKNVWTWKTIDYYYLKMESSSKMILERVNFPSIATAGRVISF